MPFFRAFQHLLPDARAWRLTAAKTLRSFVEGLAEAPAGIREFLDLIWWDIFPDTTRELGTWEQQFGVWVSSSDTETFRRQKLDAAWKAQGGQSPYYIQTILQAAGFDVYVHEWWASEDPWVARDPLDYTEQPLIGTARCSSYASQPRCRPREWGDGTPADQWRCNDILNNDPRYLVNDNLTNRAPPPIPTDSDYWPYFIYIGPETLDTTTLVHIPNAKAVEFKRLLLKLCPTQHWIVYMVDFTTGGVFDHTFEAAFE